MWGSAGRILSTICVKFIFRITLPVLKAFYWFQMWCRFCRFCNIRSASYRLTWYSFVIVLHNPAKRFSDYRKFTVISFKYGVSRNSVVTLLSIEINSNDFFHNPTRKISQKSWQFKNTLNMVAILDSEVVIYQKEFH